MVASTARTAREYLDSLPEERRDAIAAVRSIILDNLPAGFEESIQYGMLSYQVPLAVYPETYNGQAASLVGLASQKGYMSLYLLGVYAQPARRRRFEQAFKKAGKKLDMGKSCVRFKRVEDLPLNVIGDTVASIGLDEYVSTLRAFDAMRKRKPTAKAKTTAKAKPAARAKTATKAKPAAKGKTAAKAKPAARAKTAAKRAPKKTAARRARR
jgi:hypothetical protein